MVYVVNYSYNTTTVIDGRTNDVVKTIKVGGIPYGAAVNPTTNMVYVANEGSGTISVIDGNKANDVVKTLFVNAVPYAVSCQPKHKYDIFDKE